MQIWKWCNAHPLYTVVDLCFLVYAEFPLMLEICKILSENTSRHKCSAHQRPKKSQFRLYSHPLAFSCCDWSSTSKTVSASPPVLLTTGICNGNTRCEVTSHKKQEQLQILYQFTYSQEKEFRMKHLFSLLSYVISKMCG